MSFNSVFKPEEAAVAVIFIPCPNKELPTCCHLLSMIQQNKRKLSVPFSTFGKSERDMTIFSHSQIHGSTLTFE